MIWGEAVARRDENVGSDDSAPVIDRLVRCGQVVVSGRQPSVCAGETSARSPMPSCYASPSGALAGVIV